MIPSDALRLLRAGTLLLLLAGATGARADDSQTDVAQLAERTVQPTLQFRPCPENAALECGTLRVPLDYRKPWLGGVGLAVIRAKATQPERRIGVLFANPGGPGDSGVSFILGGANAPSFKRLRERFDIVSFDVRGSARSQAASCEVPLPAKPSAAGLDAFSHDVARICLQTIGPLAATMSTNTIALDVDVLRRSLGERQLSFVGASFGTVLGSVYATLFPHRVRALLLDAGILPHFRDGRVEFRAEQNLSFETAFRRLDQLCRADTACRLHKPGLVQTLAQVKARLAKAPVVAPNGAVLTPDSAGFALTIALSSESEWPLVVDAVADAQNSNHALMFALLSLTPSGGLPATTRVLTARQLIRCNDYGTRRPAAEVLPFSEAADAVSTQVAGSLGIATEVATCAAWPEADPPIIRNLRASRVPVLLLGSQFDPNTPLSWTRSLATLLGAERQVVRYQGGGHTTYATRGNTCIDAVGDRFLFELQLPEEGFSCAAQPVVFRPSAAPASPEEAQRRVQSLRGGAPTPL